MSTTDLSLELQDKIKHSITRVSKVIFPTTTNHHSTLFGGTALAWMDEVSFITATRFCRKRLVTVSTEKINFNHPIPSGTIIELVGEGNTCRAYQSNGKCFYFSRRYVCRRTRRSDPRPI